jgi:hypothetical protein
MPLLFSLILPMQKQTTCVEHVSQTAAGQRRADTKIKQTRRFTASRRQMLISFSPPQRAGAYSRGWA